MKNEKKNPFLCNVDLFSLSYFLHRVGAEKDFKSHSDPAVVALYETLQKLWQKNEKLLTNPKINESDTEKLLVDTVVRELGYSFLTKSALSSGKKTKKKFPDYALFATNDAANQALNSDDEYKFEKSLGVIEGKKFGLKLNDIDEDDEDDRLPAVQLVDYLQKTALDWGFLTNGKQWQIYCRRGQYNVSRYFEVELTDLLSHPKPTHEFAVFVYLFHISALTKDKVGKNRLDRIFDISRKYTQDVGVPFYEGCDDSLRAIFQVYQGHLKCGKDQFKSKNCHQASIILLFRLIAIRYLEDRGVLPVRDSKYRHLSLDRMKLEIEKKIKTGEKFSKKSFDIWQKVRLLFKDVNSGAFGIYLGHRGFESDLFEIDFDSFFRDNPIPDDVFSTVIDGICRGAGKNASQIDFYDLGVEKIGDVYNQLLALRLVMDEKGVWNLTYSESVKKELGSYFTHPSLTHLLSGSVIDYLRAHFPDDTEWLKLKICDNSCGSGHFLRQMIEDISYQLYISRNNTSKNEVQKVLDQNSFRRMLAQHCIFGIDRDINAVWLTKLSLWLHTAEHGKPFVFLDHHVIQGDSILSTAEIPQIPAKDLEDINDYIGRMDKQHSEDKEGVLKSQKLWSQLKSVTKRHVKLQNPQLSFFETAKEIKETYFSYALSFPEVFLNAKEGKRGFNVIVGNPPWDTVKPKVPDFYKLETGEEKAPARKVIDAWLEKDKGRMKRYEHYRENLTTYAKAIKEAGYSYQAGEVTTYAYFTERSMQTLSVNGLLCYIVKLGLYGDEKVKGLRHNLFADNYMERMWVVKSNKLDTIKFFPAVDPNEKFLVFVTRKAGLKKPKETLDYQLKAKQINSIDDVNHDFADWQTYNVKSELDSLSKITVYDTETRKSISSKIKSQPTIKSVGLEIARELDLTLDRKFFTETKTDIPIYSGFELQHFGLKPPESWCKDKKKILELSTSGVDRLAVNDIIPNSRRKIRCAEIPKGTLCANSLLLIHKFKSDTEKNLTLASINSMLVDYFLRPNLSNMHLNNFRLYDLPVPIEIPEMAKQEIVIQVKRLKKAKEFSEDLDAYKKIEGTLAACFGLTDEEIREYIQSFGGADISNDVVDYAQIARKEYGLSKTTKPKKSIKSI